METTNRDDRQHVGPYQIQDRIGSGGYAEVFSGTDTRNGNRVALKRLRLKHLDDADSRERFRREGLALEAIDHPNIVRCFGILVEEDEVWIVMELLKGFTLRQLLRERGPLSVERALLIAIDVADGLADMHEMAIVHRDLKPENVFLAMPGFQVKVVDLGVAKFHGWSVPTTDPGTIVCTPSYSAPEMSFGYTVDARSDIYALGLVLFEMLVGKNPFANGDGTLPRGQDALTAHIVRTPPPVSSGRPDVPEAVATLVAQMLDKDPTGRPPAMKVVARELRRALRSLRQPRTSRPSRPSPVTAFPAVSVNSACAMTAVAMPLRESPGLFLLPPVADPPDRRSVATPAIELRRPIVRIPAVTAPRPAVVQTAVAAAAAEALSHDRYALGLVVAGTMLIGAACGVVLSVRFFSLPHSLSASLLYTLIVIGALAGTAGALLLPEGDPSAGIAPPPRPSAWILAIGIAAGLVLGAAATWVLVAPAPAPDHALRRPS